MKLPFYNNSDKTPCWVYLLEVSRGEYSINYSLLPPDKIELPKSSHIVFYRSFQGVANGIAYKLLLENMAPKTIKEIIQYVSYSQAT